MSINNKGFTLIELMIVVAIIGVLAAIAYPSYESFIVKSKRADMMTELQNVASNLQSEKLAQGSYNKVVLNSLFSSTPNSDGEANFPATGTALYTVTATPNDKTKLSGSQWIITAVPKAGRMASDGTLTLDHQGIKCRNISTIKKCGSNDEWNK